MSPRIGSRGCAGRVSCLIPERSWTLATPASTRMAAGERETLGTYPHQCLWSKRMECLKDAGDHGYERFEAVAIGNQHDDGDGKRFEVLLECDVLVGGEDRVEFGGGLSEERTVAQAGPAHLRNRTNIVAYEQVSQRSRQRFIEQESHAMSVNLWRSLAPRPLVPA